MKADNLSSQTLSSQSDSQPNQFISTPKTQVMPSDSPKYHQVNQQTNHQKYCLGSLDMINLPAYAYTQIPERYFMNSLIKHTAIAVVIIMSLAVITMYL